MDAPIKTKAQGSTWKRGWKDDRKSQNKQISTAKQCMLNMTQQVIVQMTSQQLWVHTCMKSSQQKAWIKEGLWSPTPKWGLLATDGCWEKERKFLFRDTGPEKLLMLQQVTSIHAYISSTGLWGEGERREERKKEERGGEGKGEERGQRRGERGEEADEAQMGKKLEGWKRTWNLSKFMHV